MSSLATPELATPRTPANIELWFRRVMMVFAIAAALGLITQFAVMMWARSEFTGPESIVNAHAEMLARHGTLYYDLKTYPFTICAYMPIVYTLQAALIRIGLTSAIAGRLLSFAALLGICAMLWRLAIIYTRNRYCAFTAVLCAASTSILVLWGTTGQVDMVAIFFSIAAFERFSKHHLLQAGVLAALAIFTKQTALACPVTIFVLLWLERKRIALLFGGVFLAITGGAVLLIDRLLDGRFLLNTVRANLNPFLFEKLTAHLKYFFPAAGCLLLIALLGLPRLDKRTRAPFVYLGFALAMMLATAPKLGSDFNYQIETNVVLMLCAVIALDRLDFFPLSFAGSKVWITLLQIPLAVHLAVNLRITGNLLLARIAREQQFRGQLAALRPYVDGRFLSTDLNSMVRLRGEIEVDPLIFSEMANHKRIDLSPVRRDLAAENFSTVCLWTDVSKPQSAFDNEIANLPADDLNEIRKRYQLVAHVPGPYLNGLFVYKPVR